MLTSLVASSIGPSDSYARARTWTPSTWAWTHLGGPRLTLGWRCHRPRGKETHPHLIYYEGVRSRLSRPCRSGAFFAIILSQGLYTWRVSRLWELHSIGTNLITQQLSEYFGFWVYSLDLFETLPALFCIALIPELSCYIGRLSPIIGPTIGRLKSRLNWYEIIMYTWTRTSHMP